MALSSAARALSLLAGLGLVSLLPASPAAAPVRLRPRSDKLVHSEWVAKRSAAWRLYHVSWGEPTAYREAHIPGAVHFDTDRIERPPLWKLIADAELERALLELGITRTTPVLLYGEPNMAATRVALALLYAGVVDVR